MKNTTQIYKMIEDIIEEGNLSRTDFTHSFLCPRVTQGMHILKTMDFVDPKDDTLIFMDDLECANDFLSRPNLVMQDIIDYFDASKPSYHLFNCQEHNGRKVVPFSKIMRDKIGQCVEMSILAQLSFQKKNEKSLLCGGKTNQDRAFSTHAWNLIKREGQYFIYDCALRFYAPLKELVVESYALHLHPDYEKSMGNKENIVYKIGGDE